jgi:hypothetical protein
MYYEKSKSDFSILKIIIFATASGTHFWKEPVIGSNSNFSFSFLEFPCKYKLLFLYCYGLQTCNRPDSNLSSPSYTSSHSSATLDTDKPVTGQYLNNDIAQCNQDSTGFQGYQQNVSIIWSLQSS